jgi:hypothetical protein
MKTMKIGALCLTLLLAVTGLASAASNDVLVLFNGQTEVNRETYKFLMRNVSEMNLGVTLKASQDPSSVKPGTYKAIMVLNSGLKTGTDPVLKKFIDGYTAKKELFVVNLLAGSTTLTIQKSPAASNPSGVDTVTAASAWSEGSDKMTYITYHKDWITVFADFLKKK